MKLTTEQIHVIVKAIRRCPSYGAAVNVLKKLDIPLPEPIKAQVGDWVVCDESHRFNSSPGWVQYMEPHVGCAMLVNERPRADAIMAEGYTWLDQWLRLASRDEVIATKLKMLKRGCRVDTPRGPGVYLGTKDEEGYWVSPDAGDPGDLTRYQIDDIIPLP